MILVVKQYTHVVGVDPHAKTHTYAILSSATGQVQDTATFRASPPGIARTADWKNRRAGEGQLLVSVEGASSYGAGLTRALRGAGMSVCDVRPHAGPPGGGGESPMPLMQWQQRSPSLVPRSLPCSSPAPTVRGTPCGSCWMPDGSWIANAQPTG